MLTRREPPTEAEVIATIRQGRLQFPPARLSYDPVPRSKQTDGHLTARWGERGATYAFEYRNSSTPRSLRTAVQQAQANLSGDARSPLVILPYLSEQALAVLEQETISGLDLCGNGLLFGPDFLLRRTGEPNLFKEIAPQRNVFRGTSSILARCFLLQRHFPTAAQLREFALSRLPRSYASELILTKGTVSKVVQALEEEQLIVRDSKGLTLAAADALLEKLQQNTRRPGSSVVGKTPQSQDTVWTSLAHGGLAYVATGLSSATRFRVLHTQKSRLTLYVTELSVAKEQLQFEETEVFPNIELVEEPSPVVYFDAREEDQDLWASPIQTALELSLASPREQQAGQELKRQIVAGHYS